MGKPKQKQKRKTKRAIRQRLKALERVIAARETAAAPTWAERRAEADRIVERLREKLRIASKKGTHTGVPEGDVTLTSPLAIELAHRFGKMADDTKERQRADRAEFLRRSAGRWTRLLRGEPDEVEQKDTADVISIGTKLTAKGDSIAAAFSAANSGGFESDDYSNVRGMSESELWRWQAEHRRGD